MVHYSHLRILKLMLDVGRRVVFSVVNATPAW